MLLHAMPIHPPHAANLNRCTALVNAAANSHTEMCQYLVQEGANVNGQCRSGEAAPLHVHPHTHACSCACIHVHPIAQRMQVPPYSLQTVP